MLRPVNVDVKPMKSWPKSKAGSVNRLPSTKEPHRSLSQQGEKGELGRSMQVSYVQGLPLPLPQNQAVP